MKIKHLLTELIAKSKYLPSKKTHQKTADGYWHPRETRRVVAEEYVQGRGGALATCFRRGAFSEQAVQRIVTKGKGAGDKGYL